MLKEVLYLIRGKENSVLYLFFGYTILALLDVLSLSLVIPFISIFFGDGDIPYLNINIFNLSSDVESAFLLIGGIFLLVFLLRAIIAVWVNYKILSFSKDLDVSLRMNLLEAYQNLPLVDFNNRNSSDYIFTINSRVTELTNGVLPKSLRAISDILVMVLISSFLLLIEPKIVLSTALLLFIFSFLYISFFKPYLESAAIDYQANGNLMNKALQDGVHGIKEVRTYNASKYFINKLKKSSKILGRSLVKEELISLSPRLFLEFILVFLVLVVSYFLLIGNSNLEHTVSVLGVFSIAAVRLMPISISLIGVSSTLKFSKISVGLIYNELKKLHDYKKDKDKDKDKDILDFDSIEFKDVSFSYKKDNTLLNNINFKINRGDLVGIYGESGSGKSTLVDLIMGFYKCDKGTILINGQPINDNTLNLFAYIPQQASITNDSIKNNIAFGVDIDNICSNKLNDAINDSQLKSFVDSLPEKENTTIGENGAKISGGQRQRIAIARAFYHDRKVLILDESTSALDSKTEGKVIKELSSLKGSKSIILISHNKETLDNCDYILNLIDGKVIKSKSTF